MARDSTPTVRTRLLGRELRKVRLERGLSIESAAAKIDRSPSSLSRAENGKVCLPVRDLPFILNQYEVTDSKTRQRILDLAHAANKKNRLQEYGGTAESDQFTVEASASTIQVFQPMLIPGLLQTRSYATVVVAAVPPKPSAQKIDRQVEFRLTRQRLLAAPAPPRYQAILNEAALRLPVGGRDVMRSQLHRLLEASEQPHITIRVLPHSLGAHAGVNGGFTIMDVPEIADGHLVFVDSLTSRDYIEAEPEVRRYRLVFDHLWATALAEPDSQAMIRQAANVL